MADIDSPQEIMAYHADFVSNGVRHCSCGLWEDDSPNAQYSRVPFAEHVLDRLALYNYVLPRSVVRDRISPANYPE